MLTQEAKQRIIEENAVHEGDTGSPEVQIALLTARIVYLTFETRSFEDGRSSPETFELSLQQRYRALSCNHREAELEKVRKGRGFIPAFLYMARIIHFFVE